MNGTLRPYRHVLSKKIHVKGTFCEAYFKEILMKELIFTKEANKIISEKNLRDTFKILKINITETIIVTLWAE